MAISPTIAEKLKEYIKNGLMKGVLRQRLTKAKHLSQLCFPHQI